LTQDFRSIAWHLRRAVVVARASQDFDLDLLQP
jgi:hypothetical protein